MDTRSYSQDVSGGINTSRSFDDAQTFLQEVMRRKYYDVETLENVQAFLERTVQREINAYKYRTSK